MISKRQIAKDIYLRLREYAPKLMDIFRAIWKEIENNGKITEDITTFISHVKKNHNVIQDSESYIKIMERRPNDKIDIKHMNIAFLVPEPIRGSGGHRNIYRAASKLREFGHFITVYYIQTQKPAKKIKQEVSEWFYDMRDIPFICYEGELGFHDVAVATWWETVYLLEKNSYKVKQKIYFTQDFEAYFYPMSTEYILAENTYKMGFPCICSGPWMSTYIRDRYNAKADYFQFPVDRNIYNTRTVRTKKNKNLIFFAKPDMPRRCYTLGVQALNEFSKIKPEIEIILFGSEHILSSSLPFPATVVRLLPTLNDLANLYRNADLGLVFSTTNPSLVPYEMLSCGCPVADLDLEFAKSKYGNSEDNVFLLPPNPQMMGECIAQIFDNPEEMNNRAMLGRAWVKDEFPSEEDMAYRVEELIIKYVLE